MVIANVLNIYTTALGLWQYDYGQILRIQGLTLPTAVEIHFSLSERGGQAVTRVGTTRDNVTDVVIPDSMLENADTAADYKIYAFIYLADQEIGQTEYKISMSVRSRPRPEQFEKQEDGELFRKAISEVNKSADSALQSKKEAEAWAHGHAEYADHDEDNAKYYAKQAKDEAEKIQGFDDHVASKKEEATDEIAKARKNAVNAVVAQGTKTAKELEDVKNVASGYAGDAQRYANNASSAASAAQSYESNADTSSKSAATSASKATTALADINRTGRY